MSVLAVARVGDEDALRARFYGLLGALLTVPPNAQILDSLAAMRPDASPLGEALGRLAQAATAAKAEAVDEEFTALFIGVGRGELLPYGSYYRTGFLNDQHLAVLRGDLAQLGIERQPWVTEPEDHVGTLCEVMAELIERQPALPLAEQKHFFERHLAGWAPRFFTELESCPQAAFYRPVGTLGRLFLEVEADAFAMID